MANIAIERIAEPWKHPLPLFQEMEKQFEQVRGRAFQLFETRGCELGHDIDDWIRAEHEVMGWSAAELVESDGTYKLEMTLPGFDPKQIEVAATPSAIVVHAEIKGGKKAAEHVLWTEFGPNCISRRFELPKPIDVNKTRATLDHGLLKVLAEKAPAAKPAAIPIAG